MTKNSEEKDDLYYRKKIIEKLKKIKRTIPQEAARVDLNKGTLYLYLKGETQMLERNLQKILDDLKIK